MLIKPKGRRGPCHRVLANGERFEDGEVSILLLYLRGQSLSLSLPLGENVCENECMSFN